MNCWKLYGRPPVKYGGCTGGRGRGWHSRAHHTSVTNDTNLAPTGTVVPSPTPPPTPVPPAAYEDALCGVDALHTLVTCHAPFAPTGSSSSFAKTSNLVSSPQVCLAPLICFLLILLTLDQIKFELQMVHSLLWQGSMLLLPFPLCPFPLYYMF